MKHPRQFNIIILATRAVAKLVEIKPGHVVRDISCLDLTPFNIQALISGRRLRRQTLKAAHQALLRRVTQWLIIQLSLLQSPQAIINPAIDVDDLCAPINKGDGRQEAHALQTIFIQTIRDNIGRCHQDHAALKQALKQTRQDHCIGNI